MNVYSVVLICLAAALACMLLRPLRPELAMGVALAGAVAVLVTLRGDLLSVMKLLQTLAGQTALDRAQSELLLRACGVALVSQFGADLCRDAGESALAGRAEFAARLALLGMAAPFVQSLLRLASGLTA